MPKYARDQGDSFLLGQFQEFYREVIDLKEMVLSGTWVLAPKAVTEQEPPQHERVNAVWQRLSSLLEQQQVTAAQLGGEYWTSLHREALYVMAAFADEVFLHLDWEERGIWKSNLLESKFFKSHNAGDMFFEKLERLIQNRDPIYTGLAKLYLMALALGFQGKYRGLDRDIELYNIRRRLFYFISRRDPDIHGVSKQLFPEAYSATLDEGRGKRLPNVRKWAMVLGGLVLALLVIGHGIWIYLTADLQDVIRQILMGT